MPPAPFSIYLAAFFWQSSVKCCCGCFLIHLPPWPFSAVSNLPINPQPCLLSPCLYSWHCQQLIAHQASVSCLRLHSAWDQEQLHTHCFSLSLGFLWFGFFGGRRLGLGFGFFVLVLLSSSLQTQIDGFISNVFIFFYCSSGNLYIGDCFENILTILNKLSEKPEQYNRLVWLSPLQSLACLGLLCFHFPRGWTSDVLWNPQSRIQMFKWQKPVLSNPNAQGYFFWQDPGTQAVILICWMSAFH